MCMQSDGNVPFKMQHEQESCTKVQKLNKKLFPLYSGLSPTFLVTLESVLLWLLCCCCHKLCSSAGASMMYSQVEHVFILEHYIVSESSAAVCEALAMHIEYSSSDVTCKYILL
jgi:hypothetical protein